MSEPRSAESFWNDPDLVASYSSELSSLPYEVDLIDRVTAGAAASKPVRLIHVIGVGGGRELKAIREAAPDAEIRAWDISASMVEACRRKVESQSLGRVFVEQADMSEMSQAATDADVVIALGAVLGYSTSVQQRESDFDSLRSLLRPGGTLGVVVQQRAGRPDWAVWLLMRSVLTRLGLTQGGAGDRLSRHGGASVLFHHYSRRELRRLCSDSGFENIAVESLRQWGRGKGQRIPTRSPNPLLLSATNAGT